MGGRDSQGYRIFQELTVKAFLAIRPYTEQLVDTVRLMLETALPSFKGEGTITRLRQRFQPQLTERKAAEYMVSIIKDARENKRSNLYDEFQRLQNGCVWLSVLRSYPPCRDRQTDSFLALRSSASLTLANLSLTYHHLHDHAFEYTHDCHPPLQAKLDKETTIDKSGIMKIQSRCAPSLVGVHVLHPTTMSRRKRVSKVRPGCFPALIDGWGRTSSGACQPVLPGQSL